MKKLITRLKVIAAGGISRVMLSFSNVIISLVVVKTQSASLWGELVVYLLIIDTGFSIVSWGSSPFLIREFSLRPKDITTSWNQSFSSRALLLPLFVITVFLTPFSINDKSWICLWILSRFLYQSFEPLIQYHRHFIFSLMIELAGLAIILVPVVSSQDQFGVSTLVALFSLSQLFKAIATAIFYRTYIKAGHLSFQFFVQSFPFLLLTFSAMIQQRADIYSVAFFLNKTDLARYQVFVNLLIFAQFGGSLFLSPFAKNIFRLPRKTFLKMERSFALAGLILSAASMLAVYLIVLLIYEFEYSSLTFALGYVYVLMFYFYLMRNYLLGKQNKQLRASIYSLVGCGINSALCLWLTPRYGIDGALAAGVAGQVSLVMLYHQNDFADAGR